MGSLNDKMAKKCIFWYTNYMFELYGIWHILIILFPLIASALLIFFTRKLPQEKSFKIGFWISTVALIILILRSISYVIWGWLENPELSFFPRLFSRLLFILPLQICHLANIIFFIAYKKRSNILFGIGYAVNFPAALLALVFAGDLQYLINTPNDFPFLQGFNAFVYIIGHALLVIMPLFSLYHKHFKLNLKDAIKVIISLGILYIFFFGFDNIYNYIFYYKLANFSHSNYFFALWGQGGFPLETFTNIGKNIWAIDLAGGWFTFNPIYMAMTMGLGTVLIFLFYGIYLLLNWIFDFSKYRRTLNYEAH